MRRVTEVDGLALSSWVKTPSSRDRLLKSEEKHKNEKKTFGNVLLSIHFNKSGSFNDLYNVLGLNYSLYPFDTSMTLAAFGNTVL